MADPPTSDFEGLVAGIGRALDEAGVPYMIIGGQAVLLHGEPRIMTHAYPKELDPTSMETNHFLIRPMAMYDGATQSSVSENAVTRPAQPIACSRVPLPFGPSRGWIMPIRRCEVFNVSSSIAR